MDENKGLEKGFKGSYWWFDHPANKEGYLDEERLKEPSFSNSVSTLSFHDRDYSTTIPYGLPFSIPYGKLFWRPYSITYGIPVASHVVHHGIPYDIPCGIPYWDTMWYT